MYYTEHKLDTLDKGIKCITIHSNIIMNIVLFFGGCVKLLMPIMVTYVLTIDRDKSHRYISRRINNLNQEVNRPQLQ